VTIDSSTFQSNDASDVAGPILGEVYYAAGGVCNAGGTVTIDSSTFHFNSASGGDGRYAGGVYSSGGVVTIDSSTFFLNSFGGSATPSIANSGATPVRLENTIVSGEAAALLSGAFVGGSNLIEDGTGGIPGTITGDPRLGPLQDNGGPTFTMALLPGSPAVDAGDAALLPAGTAYDQRGPGFSRVVGGRLDIGAFEVQAAPTIENVGSPTGDGSYGVGATITIRVRFSEPVVVTGSPTLDLNSGGAAVYASGSGTNVLVFSYVVAAGQDAADLDAASASALRLRGGSIRDADGLDADRTVPVAPTAGALAVNRDIVVDTTAPTVENVGSPTGDGVYGLGAAITIRVRFSEPVVVTGSPTLSLSSGGTASYASGSGTNVLVFTYIVGAGESSPDLDAASTSALRLNGGSITDEVDVNPNAAVTTVPVAPTAGALAVNRDIVIDTTVPAVVSVDTTTPDGAYGVGQTIIIDVRFSSPVAVAGGPTLGLNSGGAAQFSAVVGGDTLRFVYMVAAGEDATDLDAASASALMLNGGSITDPAGVNAAATTVPVAPASGSLGAGHDIVIDTTAPQVVAYRVLYGSRSYDLVGASRLDLPWTIAGVQVVFSEPIASGSAASLSGLPATGLGGLGTDTLTWSFAAIAKGSFATLLSGAGADALRDAAGNALGAGLGFAQSFRVLYGDFTGDGAVSSVDLTGVRLAALQPYDAFADLNGDGVVDAADAQIARGRIGAAL
jgi:hypothetical protein